MGRKTSKDGPAGGGCGFGDMIKIIQKTFPFGSIKYLMYVVLYLTQFGIFL